MASYHIYYKGCCTDRAVQEELLKYLRIFENQCISSRVREKLDRADSKMRENGPVDSGDSECSNFDYKKDLEEIKRNLFATGIIRSFDQTLEGNLILDTNVALDCDQLLREARERNIKEKINRCWRHPKRYLYLSSIGVHGIEFEVSSPSTYPGSLSFVFLVCPEIPALHGCMVELGSRPQYSIDYFEDADWFIEVPSVGVNHCLSNWVWDLIKWVSYFFVPNMNERGPTPFSEHCPGLEKRVCELGSRELAKKEEIRRLMNGFNEEADLWSKLE